MPTKVKKIITHSVMILTYISGTIDIASARRMNRTSIIITNKTSHTRHYAPLVFFIVIHSLLKTLSTRISLIAMSAPNVSANTYNLATVKNR